MGKVIDHIEDVYLAEGRNCAETLYRAALRSRGRAASPAECLAMLGFGGGFSVGSVCGAIVGGVAALGCLLGGDGVEETTVERCKDAVAEFYALCNEAFDAVDCEDIKPVWREEETRCLRVVNRTAELLEKVLQAYGA